MSRQKIECVPECTWEKGVVPHAVDCPNHGRSSGPSVPYALRGRSGNGNRAIRVTPELREKLEAVRLLGLVPEAIEALRGVVAKSTHTQK